MIKTLLININNISYKKIKQYCSYKNIDLFIGRDATENPTTRTLCLVMPRDGLHSNDWKYAGRMVLMVLMDILGGLL
jgi:hypothetical protein